MANEKIEKLHAWGADTEMALNRFMEDEELYIECLEMIVGDKHFDALADAMASKKYKEAFEHAHCLKDVSGNLGLTPLFDAMCEVVEPLRKDHFENIEEKYKAMLEKYEEYLQIMK